MVQSTLRALTIHGEPLLRRGLELYSAGEFFECHEVLEELWQPMRGPHRLFLQALIHFAVAFYHLERHNSLGAERQLSKGLCKLGGYLPAYAGIDTAALHRDGAACLASIQTGQTPAAPCIRMTGAPSSEFVD